MTQAETAAAYDVVAETYQQLLAGALADDPHDRAALDVLAQLVARDPGPVADVGCGTGRITCYLAAAGLDVHGVDPSPGMLAVARREHPHLRFVAGSFTALPCDDDALAGALAWYSLIHLDAADRERSFAEFARALRPAGHLLLAFQVGSDVRVNPRAYGHDVVIRSFRLDPAATAEALDRHGFDVVTSTVRRAEPPMPTPQCYLLAQRR